MATIARSTLRSAGMFIARGCQLFLGTLLVWAAISKGANPEAFLGQVEQYQLASPTVEGLIAMAMPWIELITGLSLMMGFLVLSASINATCLFGFFAIAQLLTLHHGLKPDCGCGLPGRLTPIGWVSVSRSILLMVAAILTFWKTGLESRVASVNHTQEIHLCVQ